MTPHDTRLHEDDVFGHLTLDSLLNGHFLLQYEGWKVTFNAEILDILERGSVPETYFMERIAKPFQYLMTGHVLLHAGTIACNGGAVALLAESGTGKSTLTAGFMAFDACSLVADDMTVLHIESGAQVLPISTQIAMRHAMFDRDAFVTSIAHNGYKPLLSLREDKICRTSIPLRYLVFLDGGDITPPVPVSFAHIAPRLLRQQMAISNPPESFARQQFRDIMALRDIPCLRMGISCKTRSEVEQSCAQLLKRINDET